MLIGDRLNLPLCRVHNQTSLADLEMTRPHGNGLELYLTHISGITELTRSGPPWPTHPETLQSKGASATAVAISALYESVWYSQTEATPGGSGRTGGSAVAKQTVCRTLWKVSKQASKEVSNQVGQSASRM